MGKPVWSVAVLLLSSKLLVAHAPVLHWRAFKVLSGAISARAPSQLSMIWWTAVFAAEVVSITLRLWRKEVGVSCLCTRLPLLFTSSSLPLHPLHSLPLFFPAPNVSQIRALDCIPSVTKPNCFLYDDNISNVFFRFCSFFLSCFMSSNFDLGPWNLDFRTWK